jgi:5-methylcytosine-specific restriction endonuclease McrA
MVLRKPCLECGVPSRTSRCPSCSEKILLNRPRPTKPGSTQRGYDAHWQKIRRLVLDRDGWVCYLCQKQLVGSDATVDHIISLKEDYSLRLDSKNLAACCRSCNSKKKNK